MLARPVLNTPAEKPSAPKAAHRGGRASRTVWGALLVVGLSALLNAVVARADALSLADQLRASVKEACSLLTVAPEPPEWVVWHARSYAVDVPSADGVAEGRLVVGAGRAALAVDDTVMFVTPDAWCVSDACMGDLDGDGAPEAIFLAWRQGNYGSSRPFWEEEPASSEAFTQHVFVYGWCDGVLQPRWMSSQLGASVESLGLSKAGEVLLTERDGSTTVWAWESWGLTLTDRFQAAESRVTVLVTGDVIAHTPVYESAYNSATRAFDFTPIFAPLAPLVGAADFAVVGQETPLVSEPALRSGYPRFATPNTLGEALVATGFDAVLAASNHMLDYGARGVGDTLTFWETHPEVTLLGLHPTAEAAAELDSVTVQGITLGLLNYTYGTNGYGLPADAPYQLDCLTNEEALVAAVTRARENCDVVACFLHIGEEYVSEPSQEQREIVERLVDAGADLVLCSHSHVAGPWETLATPAGNEAVVCWGLGNCVAVQDRLDCIVGCAARITLERWPNGTVGVSNVELVPTVCHTSRTGDVRVYPLGSYTNELAAEHCLNDMGQPVTVATLWGLYGEHAYGRL